MAGKACVLTNRRLHLAIDSLSKNSLIDLLVDRVRAEIGEDATDEQVAWQVEQWLGPVLRARGDKPTNLVGKVRLWDKKRDDYVARHGNPNESADMIASRGGHDS